MSGSEWMVLVLLSEHTPCSSSISRHSGHSSWPLTAGSAPARTAQVQTWPRVSEPLSPLHTMSSRAGG